MRAEISFDLRMEDQMSFVEGVYRLPGGEWQMFIFSPRSTLSRPEVVNPAEWASGATGIHVRWPKGASLNRLAVLSLLSKQLGVTEWAEVRGSDSMSLR